MTLRLRLVTTAVAVSLLSLWISTNLQQEVSAPRHLRVASSVDPLLTVGSRCPKGTVHYGRAQTIPGEAGVRGGLVCRQLPVKAHAKVPEGSIIRA